MAYDYEFRLRVHAPRPVVFERLLRIEHLARWFCGWARIEPKVGGSFRFGGETCIFPPEGRGWDTRIDEGEALRTFAFTWPIRGAATRVSYEITDAGPDASVLNAAHRGVPVAETTCGSVQDAWRTCLGNLKSIAEGRGDSVRPDHGPPAQGALQLATLIEAPRSKVYEAITDPTSAEHWLTGGASPGRAGARAAPFPTGIPGAPERILERDPGRRLVLGWPRPRGETRVALDLEEKASGTAIYLTATGYPPEAGADIVRDRGRWSDWFVALKNLVEGGDSGFANPYADQVRET